MDLLLWHNNKIYNAVLDVQLFESLHMIIYCGIASNNCMLIEYSYSCFKEFMYMH